jgi:hypothetical protein
MLFYVHILKNFFLFFENFLLAKIYKFSQLSPLSKRKLGKNIVAMVVSKRKFRKKVIAVVMSKRKFEKNIVASPTTKIARKDF